MSDSATLLLTIAMTAALLICIGLVIRRLWRAVTNPQTAYRLGRSTRKAGEGAASAVGHAAEKAEALGRAVNRSFQEGRISANGSHINRDGA